MKTAKGSFPEVYNHINTPTHSDQAYFEEHKKRKLIVPKGGTEEFYGAFRDISLAYLCNADWTYKRKMDGEHQRVKWDGEQALWNGKSNAYNCPKDWEDYMNNTFLEEIFEEKFGHDKTVILFGERMGNKVQNNELGIDTTEFVLFDVCIDGTYLGQDAINEIARAFNIRSCFDFMYGSDQLYVDSLYNLIKQCANGDFKEWEGIVATPQIELKNGSGDRIITKIKTRDYFVQ